MNDLHLVFVTAPSDQANALAETLVERRLAACVNLLPGVQSVYRWQGKLNRDEESLLICKTTLAGLPALEAAVQELHPYEVPEIVAIAAASVNRPYADWVSAEVGT
jgi:periplasmic divalent cation tolerance protein